MVSPPLFIYRSIENRGCLRYVEKIKAVRSLQYVENRSLHNVECLQILHNEEMISQQYVEKVSYV